MNPKLPPRFLLGAIFALAIALRVLLAGVNHDANDNHHHVTQLIIGTQSLTHYGDCGQCYHPKLFHLTAAATQLMLGLERRPLQVRLGQYLNVSMAILLLLMVWVFIRRQSWAISIQHLVFALVALNPKLIGINAQYTNDTFSFGFGLMAVLGAHLLLKKRDRKFVLLLVVGCVGCGLSKGSGIPLAAALLAFLALFSFVNKDRAALQVFAITLLAFVSIVPHFGNYLDNARENGQWVGRNNQRAPAAHLFTETLVARPGVTSIADSFLTFRYVDLLKNPYIVDTSEGYAPNRTSVWTQVYGRTFSVRFDQWPKTWASTSPAVLHTSRALFVLGLLPLACFLLGLLLSARSFFRGLRHRRLDSNWFDLLLMFLVLSSMVSMLVVLTLHSRDFATMKAIYLGPGMLSVVFFLGTGMQAAFTKSRRVLLAGAGLVSCLLLVSVIEILGLIHFLASPHWAQIRGTVFGV